MYMRYFVNIVALKIITIIIFTLTILFMPNLIKVDADGISLNNSSNNNIILDSSDFDGDGLDDIIENAGINLGDGNLDGFKDSIQPDSVSFIDTYKNIINITIFNTNNNCAKIKNFELQKRSKDLLYDSRFNYLSDFISFELPCNTEYKFQLNYFNKSLSKNTVFRVLDNREFKSLQDYEIKQFAYDGSKFSQVTFQINQNIIQKPFANKLLIQPFAITEIRKQS
jgi:hypothetical protein